MYYGPLIPLTRTSLTQSLDGVSLTSPSLSVFNESISPIVENLILLKSPEPTEIIKEAEQNIVLTHPTIHHLENSQTGERTQNNTIMMELTDSN